LDDAAEPGLWLGDAGGSGELEGLGDTGGLSGLADALPSLDSGGGGGGGGA